MSNLRSTVLGNEQCPSLPSLLVACKYSDLARWYILQLTCAVSVSSRCCSRSFQDSAVVVSGRKVWAKGNVRPWAMRESEGGDAIRLD